jgi:hypothetical protein
MKNRFERMKNIHTMPKLMKVKKQLKFILIDEIIESQITLSNMTKTQM